jgi:hypothetical protein
MSISYKYVIGGIIMYYMKPHYYFDREAIKEGDLISVQRLSSHTSGNQGGRVFEERGPVINGIVSSVGDHTINIRTSTSTIFVHIADVVGGIVPKKELIGKNDGTLFYRIINTMKQLPPTPEEEK